MKKILQLLFMLALILIWVEIPSKATGDISNMLICVSSDGIQGNGSCWVGDISADGRYIVFVSNSTNLVPNDDNNTLDIFLYDRQTRLTELVSRQYDVSPVQSANSASGLYVFAKISANSRYIVYSSDATDLVATDTNGFTDIFIYDIVSKENRLISLDSFGNQANHISLHPSISADGRYVAFMSQATNLGSDNNLFFSDVFLRDTQTNQTILISKAYNINEFTNGSSSTPVISSDGNYIAFFSNATNLVSDVIDTNNGSDIFVYNRNTNETKLISFSHTSVLSTANNYSYVDSISANGCYISFTSLASDLIPTDVNTLHDVFLYDCLSNQISLISHAYNDITMPAHHDSTGSSISADGRYVAFMSRASNLNPDVIELNQTNDIYVYNRQLKQHFLISTPFDATNYQTANDTSEYPIISADGKYVIFASMATNLIFGDTNGHYDVYLREVNLQIPDSFSSLQIVQTEFTQVIQDSANSVPMVANKPTLVRVYPECSGCPETGISGVTAIIEGPNGETIIPDNRAVVAFPNVGDWTRDEVRGHLNRSLNFTLPLHWTTAGERNFTIYLRVNRPRMYGYTSLPVFDTEVRTVKFNQMQNVKFDEYELKTLLPSSDYPDQSHIDNSKNILRAILPLSYIYFERHSSYTVFSGQAQIDLMNFSLERLIRRHRSIGIGWIRQKGFSEGGIANIIDISRTLISTLINHDTIDTTLRDGAVATHELGHIVGLGHLNPRVYPDIFGNPPSYSCDGIIHEAPSYWTYPDDSIQDWGVYLIDTRWVLMPDNTYDVMSYCRAQTNSLSGWLAPYTYIRFFNYFVENPNDRVSLPSALSTTQSISLPQDETPQDVVSIFGSVDLLDNANFDYVRQWNITEPLSTNTGTTYCLESQNASNAVLYSTCFDLDFYINDIGDVDTDMFFVNIPQNVAIARIVLKKGATELAVLTPSNTPPTITLTAPNGGEVWSANTDYTISWVGNDADMNPLKYDVSYTYNGVDWVVIAADITDTSLVVNSGDLAGGTNARVRVSVSDGFYTVSDESDAEFSVPKHAPQAELLGADAPITIGEDDTLILDGVGSDKEDFPLPESAYQWSSNIDGVLSSGYRLITQELSVGTHTISLVVTDSDMNTASVSQTVTITPRSVPTGSMALILPNNAMHFINRDVVFQWDSVDGAFYYQFQIATDSNFNDRIYDAYFNTFVGTHTLTDAGDYFWRVRGVNDIGIGDWSEVREFTIEAIENVGLVVNEQMLFNAMQVHLTSDMQMVLSDIQIGGILMTVSFADGAIATVDMSVGVTNGLITTQLDSVIFSQGFSIAHETAIHQNLIPIFMLALDDILGEFVAVTGLNMDTQAITLTVDRVQP